MSINFFSRHKKEQINKSFGPDPNQPSHANCTVCSTELDYFKSDHGDPNQYNSNLKRDQTTSLGLGHFNFLDGPVCYAVGYDFGMVARWL